MKIAAEELLNRKTKLMPAIKIDNSGGMSFADSHHNLINVSKKKVRWIRLKILAQPVKLAKSKLKQLDPTRKIFTKPTARATSLLYEPVTGVLRACIKATTGRHEEISSRPPPKPPPNLDEADTVVLVQIKCCPWQHKVNQAKPVFPFYLLSDMICFLFSMNLRLRHSLNRNTSDQLKKVINSAMMVQIADMLDQGGEEIKILYWLQKLKGEAEKMGGKVINVEFELRYVTNIGLKEFKNWADWFLIGNKLKFLCVGLEKPKELLDGIPLVFRGVDERYRNGIRTRMAILRLNCLVASWFLSNNVRVLVVGDSGLVHGRLLKLYVELFRNVYNGMLEAKLAFDWYTYTHLVNALCKIGNLDGAKSDLIQMDKKGCSPSLIIYNVINEGMCSVGDMNEALVLKNSMAEKGLVADSFTYSMIINGLCKGKKMKEADVSPNHVTFVGVLSACVHGEKVQGEKQFFDMMKNIHQIMPNLPHYRCMDMLGRVRLLDEAREMEGMPLKLNVVIWGCLMGAYEKFGNVKM